MQAKINQLLESYQPANTILAYQLLQTIGENSKEENLCYIIDYFFDHHIDKDKKKLQIDFGAAYCQITFQLQEYEFGYGGTDTYLAFKATQNYQTILSGDFVLSYDSAGWGDIGYYHRQDFQAHLDLFYREYLDEILELLG